MSDDDFDLSRYILGLSKRIARFTKDYIGIPFNSSNHLPFQVEDPRKSRRNAFYSSRRKWQRDDPLIGFYSTQDGQKRMILNLPDGSSLLDLAYPGWEISIIDQKAMDHFFHRRYLFGDMYGHFLNGRPMKMPPPMSSTPTPDRSEPDQAELERLATAMRQRSEVFQKRRKSLQQAAAEQQQRGMPFDAQPEGFLPHEQKRSIFDGRSPVDLKSLDEALQRERELTGSSTSDKTLVNVQVSSHSTHENGRTLNKMIIKRTYSNGETETIEETEQGDGVLRPLDPDEVILRKSKQDHDPTKK